MSNIVVFVDAGFVLLLWREPSWLICSSQQRFQVRRSIRMFRAHPDDLQVHVDL
jgi:hypothetical protein